MKTLGSKPLVATLLSSLATTYALAQTAETPVARGLRAQPVPALMQAADRGRQGGDGGQRDASHGRAFGLPPNSGFAPAGGQSSGRDNGSDSQQRQGKMSPEDRRTLRRQIDEAGHDIYTPKR